MIVSYKVLHTYNDDTHITLAILTQHLFRLILDYIIITIVAVLMTKAIISRTNKTVMTMTIIVTITIVILRDLLLLGPALLLIGRLIGHTALVLVHLNIIIIIQLCKNGFCWETFSHLVSSMVVHAVS